MESSQEASGCASRKLNELLKRRDAVGLVDECGAVDGDALNLLKASDTESHEREDHCLEGVDFGHGQVARGSRKALLDAPHNFRARQQGGRMDVMHVEPGATCNR